MKSIASFFVLVMIMKNSYSQGHDSLHTDQKIAPWYVDRFRLSAGIFVPVSTTTLQVGVKGGDPGTPIDLQKDLDYNNGQVTFLATLQWRISRKSRLSLSYYNIPSSSTHKLEKDITFKDSVYHANSTVSSFFNTAIYQISYGYSIISKPNYELGVMIGTHLVGAKMGISVDANAEGRSESGDFGITAPLPDLGIWGGYTFSDRFAVNLELDYLSLTIGDYSGRLFAYNLLFVYRAMDKLDISLGYAGLNFNLDVVKNKYQASFKWGYNGPALGVTYAFGKTTWKH